MVNTSHELIFRLVKRTHWRRSIKRGCGFGNWPNSKTYKENQQMWPNNFSPPVRICIVHHMENFQSSENGGRVLLVRPTIIISWMMVQSVGFGCSKSSKRLTSSISKLIENRFGVRRSTSTNKGSHGG